jgi:hypothetical protein
MGDSGISTVVAAPTGILNSLAGTDKHGSGSPVQNRNSIPLRCDNEGRSLTPFWPTVSITGTTSWRIPTDRIKGNRLIRGFESWPHLLKGIDNCDSGCMWGHPLEGSCQEVKLRHAQLFVVFFCSCAPSDSPGLCPPRRAPVFGGCGVGAAPGPHQSPIRIKASGGGAVARTPCQPLAIAGPSTPSVPHRVHGG